MEAKQGKVVPNKRQCDRCGERDGPVREWRFGFPEGYPYWKALWEEREGRRLTNRRKARLREAEAEQLELRELSSVTYWMDLCEPCGEECSRPWGPGFPREFWGTVLQRGRNSAVGKSLVPTKSEKTVSSGRGRQ